MSGGDLVTGDEPIGDGQTPMMLSRFTEPCFARHKILGVAEFSQLDVEMSFATPDQIYALVEGLFARIFRLIGVELPIPFPRFSISNSS